MKRLLVFKMLILLVVFVYGQKEQGKTSREELVVNTFELDHLLSSDPLNNSASTARFNLLAYQSLLGVDPKTNEIVPVLAETRPIRTIENGKHVLVFKIKEDAVWDDGTPITNQDVSTTLKIILNPHGFLFSYQGYLKEVEEIICDEADPKTIKLIYEKPYALWEAIFIDIPILPKYLFDKEEILDAFSIANLKGELSDVQDIRLKEFEKKRQEMLASNASFGSGPYYVSSWRGENNIISFSKKKKWWGTKQEGLFFENKPKEINFYLCEFNEAVNLFKEGKINVLNGLAANKDYELEEKKSLSTTLIGSKFAFDYVGLNQHHSILKTKNNRLALAYLANVEGFIDDYLKGYAQPAVGMIHPEDKRFNKELKPYSFDLKKAQKILKDEGWIDSNKDGILDKMENGKRIDFRLKVLFNMGNKRREALCLHLKKQFALVGIELEINKVAWVVLLERIQSHHFDMYIGGWICSTLPIDPYPIWHSASRNDGSNYVSYFSAEADERLEKMRYSADEAMINKNWERLQELVHQDLPYLFLFHEKVKCMYDKKIKGAFYAPSHRSIWLPSLY